VENDSAALVVPTQGFICQFGIAASQALNMQWRGKGAIKDDPHVMPRGKLQRGMISFAGGGSDSRTTQLFFVLRDGILGKSNWETPVAQVVSGMDAVDAWYKGYGDSTKYGGRAPEQAKLTKEGSAWAHKEFPEMDFLKSCRVAGSAPETGAMLDPTAPHVNNNGGAAPPPAHTHAAQDHSLWPKLHEGPGDGAAADHLTLAQQLAQPAEQMGQLAKKLERGLHHTTGLKPAEMEQLAQKMGDRLASMKKKAEAPAFGKAGWHLPAEALDHMKETKDRIREAVSKHSANP
jgi:cyclophilin family peptidyl-prolyl cis-trans isomerase